MAAVPVMTHAVTNAAPTVKVTGRLNGTFQEQLLGMKMCEREGGMSNLEFRLSNSGSSQANQGFDVFDDGGILELGASLTVFAGPNDAATEIFRGKITAVEAIFPGKGPPELIVLAEDTLQAARMKRRTKTWDNTSLSAILRAVGSGVGLTVVTHGLDGTIGSEQQLNESDLHFMRRLLARYDADLQVVGSELHATPRSQAQRNSLVIDMNDQLHEVRVLADLAHQVTQVTATGWDFVEGQTISTSSQTTSLGPGAGKTGKDWLGQTLGTRSEQLAHHLATTQSEAQAIADAEFAQRSRKFVVAYGVVEGNPLLRVGSYLTLNGLGPRFSNTYYASGTVHRFDRIRGYETEFTAECAYLGTAS